MFKVLFAFLLLITITYASNNDTDTIKVIAYSQIISSISPPGGDINFIDAALINTIDGLLPDDVKVDVAAIIKLFSSTFYVVLFIVVFVLIILSIFVIGLLQCCCSICGSDVVVYGSFQRVSAYIVNFLLLFTIAVTSSLAIYFFLGFSNSAVSAFESGKTEINTFYGYAETIVSSVDDLNKLSVYNVTTGKVFQELFNATTDVHTILNEASIEEFFSFNWVPVVGCAVLIALALAACATSYFNIRVIYIIIGYLFFFAFLFLAGSAILTGSYGAFMSNFCANGIDNKMSKIIDSFDNTTCMQDIAKKYLFCEYYHETCDPWGQTIATVETGIAYVKEEIAAHNPNPNFEKALPILEVLLSNVQSVSNCSSTRDFYVSFTDDFCLGTVGSLVNLSTSLELLTLLTFLFLLVALYTWHRIKRQSDPKTTYDYETIPSKPTGDHYGELSNRPAESDASIGCFLMVILMLLFWAAFVGGAFVVFSFGAEEIVVPRT